MAVLEIEVKPGGVVRVEVNGVKGKSCIKLTEFIENTLGNVVIDRDFKPEYYVKKVGRVEDDRLYVKGDE